MKIFKSHFWYNKRQRNGVFFLLTMIVLLQLIYFFVDFSSTDKIDFKEYKVQNFQKELDSLKLIQLKKKEPKIYPFNPNYITDFKGYQLGMSVEEIDKLLKFRAEGKFVNSAGEFQKVTGVSDSLLKNISPFFKFPSWVTTNQQTNSTKVTSKPIQKQNINTASVSDFKIIYGVGDKIANRIVSYRTKLKGFSMNEQVYEVWNLDSLLVGKIFDYFEIREKPIIQKININQATFKEVLAIVYLDYELTKKIFNYRDEVAEIQSIEELKKIDGFPLEKFSRIALYLDAK
ncbi:helix-hairpin-helix domain-containing protein [uncultured Lutibacter sp.]|uniref:ComEA family DNA-binding protein n=1 Tax=uncultured Lutibacter sp. TaxID=437739 RepID=UPI002603C241|nr:helix-hairpin-helix domain-containing protein [uncultured Lutibacter sp.]